MKYMGLLGPIHRSELFKFKSKLCGPENDTSSASLPNQSKIISCKIVTTVYFSSWALQCTDSLKLETNLPDINNFFVWIFLTIISHDTCCTWCIIVTHRLEFFFFGKHHIWTLWHLIVPRVFLVVSLYLKTATSTPHTSLQYFMRAATLY